MRVPGSRGGSRARAGAVADGDRDSLSTCTREQGLKSVNFGVTNGRRMRPADKGKVRMKTRFSFAFLAAALCGCCLVVPGSVATAGALQDGKILEVSAKSNDSGADLDKKIDVTPRNAVLRP